MLENQLNEKLKNVKNYLGSYAIDEVKNIEVKSFPSFIVINLDQRTGPGNHWIALAIYSKTIYLCDSLGGIMPDNSFPKQLLNFLYTLCFQKTLYITKRLQPLLSEFCGEYCIIFIRELSKANSFCDFLDLFSSNYLQNDQIVRFLVGN